MLAGCVSYYSLLSNLYNRHGAYAFADQHVRLERDVDLLEIESHVGLEGQQPTLYHRAEGTAQRCIQRHFCLCTE